MTLQDGGEMIHFMLRF